MTLVTLKGFTVKVRCGVEDEYTRQPPLSKPLLCLLGLGEVVKAGGGGEEGIRMSFRSSSHNDNRPGAT